MCLRQIPHYVRDDRRRGINFSALLSAKGVSDNLKPLPCQPNRREKWAEGTCSKRKNKCYDEDDDALFSMTGSANVLSLQLLKTKVEHFVILRIKQMAA